MTAMLLAAGCSNESNEENNSGKEQVEQKVYNYSAAEILEKVKAAYGEDYLPNMPLDETMVSDTYGIDMADVEDFVAEMPMISTHPDMVLIVKAKEGKIDAVVEKLEAKKKAVVEDTLVYTMNIEKMAAAKVVSKGDYAAFFVLGSSENNSEDEAERKEFAEAEVQKAVDAFNNMFK